MLKYNILAEHLLLQTWCDYDIFKYVCDVIGPSERLIQRYQREYGHYFGVLLKWP